MCNVPLGDPAWAGRPDQITLCGPFQPHPCCDSVIHPKLTCSWALRKSHTGLRTSAVGKTWRSPEKRRQMDKGVRYKKGQIELVWFSKEKTWRHVIMIYPPIKTCCRADNDELCSLSVKSCNLICRRGDLDMISEMLSNFKRKGCKRLAINSTASSASLSQFSSQPCPHQQTVIVKFVPS